MVISSLEEDHARLGPILDHFKWKVRRACTRQQGLALIRRHEIAVVICERDLLDGNWRDVLNEVAPLRYPPLLIVASGLSDDFLWVEVLSMGGHDLLAKPFDPIEVVWTVSMAWYQWNCQSARSQQDEPREM